MGVDLRPIACAKFTTVYNLHTCKYTPGMYFCACKPQTIDASEI